MNQAYLILISACIITGLSRPLMIGLNCAIDVGLLVSDQLVKIPVVLLIVHKLLDRFNICNNRQVESGGYQNFLFVRKAFSTVSVWRTFTVNKPSILLLNEKKKKRKEVKLIVSSIFL